MVGVIILIPDLTQTQEHERLGIIFEFCLPYHFIHIFKNKDLKKAITTIPLLYLKNNYNYYWILTGY